MRFSFTEDQLLFRDTVRDLLQKAFPPEALRRYWDGDHADADAVWALLSEMGVVGLTVPEANDGMGMSQLDLVLLLQEAGQAGYPGLLAETTAVAAPLLAEFDPESLREEWLPRIAAGTAKVAVGLDGASYVVGAELADLVIFVRDGRVVAVPGPSLTFEPQPSVDGARHLAVVSGGEADEVVVASGEDAIDVVMRALDLGALATAAQLLGVAQAMLDVTVAYTKEREQFGVVIGSFQAIKHHLADALLQLEFAKPVVYNAAYSVSQGRPTASRDVSMAKVFASDAAAAVAATALQCHGAIAYTVEYDLHFWMKRSWALVAAWGSAAHHREQVAKTLLDPAPESALDAS